MRFAKGKAHKKYGALLSCAISDNQAFFGFIICKPKIQRNTNFTKRDPLVKKRVFLMNYDVIWIVGQTKRFAGFFYIGKKNLVF